MDHMHGSSSVGFANKLVNFVCHLHLHRFASSDGVAKEILAEILAVVSLICASLIHKYLKSYSQARKHEQLWMNHSFYFFNVSKCFRERVCPSTERNRFNSIHFTWHYIGNRSPKTEEMNTIRHKWIARSGTQRPDRVCVAPHSLATPGNLKR